MTCYCFQVNTKDKVSLFCSVKPEECDTVVVDQISKCVFDDIEGANKVSVMKKITCVGCNRVFWLEISNTMLIL